jgi:hypothetical protein
VIRPVSLLRLAMHPPVLRHTPEQRTVVTTSTGRLFRRLAAAGTGMILALTSSACLGIDPGQKRSASSSLSPMPSPSPTTTSTPPPRPVPPPASGICRRLTYRQIGRFSNASPKVSCTAPHTAYTYAVSSLPRSLSGALDSDRVQNAAQGSCRRSFNKHLGGDATARATTRLTPTYFLPRARAFANGTRWVRCDVVALLAPHKLASLPASLRGLLDDPTLSAKYAVCSQGRPGDPGSVLVICSEAHSYRAVTAILLGGADVPIPTSGQLDKPKAICRQLVAKLLGVDGGFSFVFTYPSQRQWNNGQRYGLCWNGQAN